MIHNNQINHLNHGSDNITGSRESKLANGTSTNREDILAILHSPLSIIN